FLFNIVVSIEQQLQQTFFELHGDTPENRRFERRRAYLSYATNLVEIAAYWFFLGPIAFFFFAVPASVLGFLHLVHFNWSTHNGFSPDKDFRPVNLNHGYYKIGNYLWFGIYMHANHHTRTNIFNPARMTPSLPITTPAKRTAPA